MSCRQAHERLPEWLAGRLALAEAGPVEHHLAACGECRAEADLLQATRAAFSPAALGERLEPDWAAMRQQVLRAARAEAAAPSLVERLREWLAEAWGSRRLTPALSAAAVVLVCVMGLSLTVGPDLFGPQRASTLGSLTVEELENLSEALLLEGEGLLMGAEPVDTETLRELTTLPPEELDRLLRTL